MKVQRSNSSLLILGIAVVLIFDACNTSPTESNSEKLSFSQEIKLKKYKVHGEQLYAMHCANCHQEDGSGLGRLIPPLTNLSQIDKSQTICTIKFGMEGSMIVNEVEYNGKMPSNLKLTNLEIAEILTFVGNSWQNESGLVLVSEVGKTLEQCRR